MHYKFEHYIHLPFLTLLLYENALAAAAVVTAVAIRTAVKKRKKRLMWVRSLFQKRSELGTYNYNLLMAESDTSRCQGFTQLTV